MPGGGPHAQTLALAGQALSIAAKALDPIPAILAELGDRSVLFVEGCTPIPLDSAVRLIRVVNARDHAVRVKRDPHARHPRSEEERPLADHRAPAIKKPDRFDSPVFAQATGTRDASRVEEGIATVRLGRDCGHPVRDRE